MQKFILGKAFVPVLLPVTSGVAIINDIRINSVDDKIYYSYNGDITNTDSWYEIAQDETKTLYDDVYLMHKSIEWNKIVVHIDEFTSDATSSGTVVATDVVGLNTFVNSNADVSNYLPANAIDVTYSELTIHITAGTLITNQWYRLTDYHNVNTSYFDYLHVGSNEAMFVRASSSTTLFKQIYSESFPNDVIYYDVSVDTLNGNGDGEWEDNSDSEGELSFSNWTETSVEINKHIIIDESFYFYVEDDEGDAEYELADLGVRFTVSYPTANSSVITILDGAVNFTHPDYNYGEISGEFKITDATGLITYREYPEKAIKCSFDFRGTAFARKRPDVGAMTAFTANTVYTADTTVVHQNRAYNAMIDMTSGSNPYTNKWIQVLANLDYNYLHTTGSTGSITIALDSAYKVIPMFSYWNGTDFVEDYNKVSNITINSNEDIVFARRAQNTVIQDVVIDKFARNLTFGGGVQSMYFNRYCSDLIIDLNASIQNIQIQTKLQSTIISASAYNIKLISVHSTLFGSVSNSDIGNLTYCKFKTFGSSSIGTSTNNVCFGYANRVSIGSGGSDSYFYKCENSKIGNSFKDIISYSNIFVNNQIGDLWKNFLINHNFMYNTFGNLIGNNSLTIETHGTWESNTIGSYCFISTTNNLFNGNVSKNQFGSKCDKFNIDGSCTNNVFGSNVNNITSKDLYNNMFAPNCHHFDFGGNITYCEFKAGTNTLTYNTTTQFSYNIIKTNHVTFDTTCPYVSNSTYCTIYKDNGNVRLASFDNDINVLIDPTDCSDVAMKIKAPLTVGAYTLPSTDGMSGQYLSTDGSGNLTWSSFPVTTSYPSGDRNSIWTIAKSSDAIWHSGHNDVTKLIDGASNNDTYFEDGVSIANEWLEITFDEYKQVDEIKWEQGTSSTHGTWKLQGYNNNTWEDLISSLTLGGATSTVYVVDSISSNKYNKVRLLGVSGSVSGDPWLYEWNVKVGS